MSREIDYRVVELAFDNAKFEKNIETSLDSLEKLNRGLDLSDSASRLSASAAIITGAFLKIGAEAVELGAKIAKEVTLDPLIKGFSSYEEQIGSVQVIMNATNKSIDEVESTLGRLVWFADETSYSMDQMTNAVSRFVSNNLDLDDSATAIQGIANLAALAGVQGQKAAIAFNNFADAIAKGGLVAQDYKSLELAGVTTTAFKESAIEAAKAVGALGSKGEILEGTMKGTIVTLENFKTTLSEQSSGMWFNTEVIQKQAEAFGAYSTAVNVVQDNLDIFGAASANAAMDVVDMVQSSGNAIEYLQKTFGVTAEIAEELAASIDTNNGSLDNLGKKAFLAAQESKTLSDALNYTRDALASGWAGTWKLIFGNYEEAKVVFTGLSDLLYDLVVAGGDARNAMLAVWKEDGGRQALLEGLDFLVHDIIRIFEPIQEAFRNIFPAMTGERLADITRSFRDLMAGFSMSEETTDKLRRTFEGLFAAIDLVKSGIGFVVKVVGEVIKVFGGPAAGGILGFTANLGDLIVKFRDFVNDGDKLTKAVEKVRDVFTTVADRIKDAINRIKEAFGIFKKVDITPLDDLSEKAEKSFKPFERFASIIGAAFEAVVKVIEWAAPIITKLGSIVGTALKSLADKVSNAVSNMDFNEILDLINTGLFAAILVGVKKFIGSLTSITDGAGGFLKGITSILDGVRGALEAYQNNLKAKTLLTIAAAVGILAASLLVLSFIDSDKLGSSLGALTVIFVELAATMIIMQKVLGTGKMAKVSVQLIAMSAAILILSFAMAKLAALDWNGIAKGVVGIAALAAVLVASATILNKSSGKLIKGATGLIAFAAAVLIMSNAVEKLSSLSWEELTRGLTGMTAVLAEMVIAVKLMSNTKGMVSVGIGMIAMSTAMLILASAVKNFAQMQWDEIARGLVSMAGALAAIVITMKLLPKGIISKAAGLVILGAALEIIADAMVKFGAMQWGEIARGLTVLAGALAAITLAMNFLPKGMITKAVGLIGIAAALRIMIDPLKQMGEMAWSEIAKGLVMLGGSLGILAIALNFMKGTLGAAAAVLVVSAALAVLAPVLIKLGGMSWEEIGKGLLALAGAFTVIGLAALILQPLVPTILGLSAAIALLGAGVALVGVGVLAFSAGLTALAVSASAVAGAIVLVGGAILGLIPVIFEKLGEGVIAFTGVIINGAPLFKEAFITLFSAAIEAVVVVTPMIVNGVLDLLYGILAGIDERLPAIVDVLFNILIKFIDKLAERMPELITSGVNLLVQIFRGIIDALSSLELGDILGNVESLAPVLLGLSIAIFILSKIPIIGALSAVVALGAFAIGMVALLTILGGIAQIPGLKWLVGEGADILASIGDAIGGFVGGIVGGIVTGITGSFPQIGQDLSDFMTNAQAFIEGAKNVDSSVLEAVGILALALLEITAADLLSSLMGWITGGLNHTELKDQLIGMGEALTGFYEATKNVNGAKVEAAALATLALFKALKEAPNSGGIISWFTGNNDADKVGKQLEQFGETLVRFDKSIADLEVERVEAAADTMVKLFEALKNAPTSGGMVSWFTGSNDADKVGEQLVLFGDNLSLFGIKVNALPNDKIVNASSTMVALFTALKEAPNTGGMVSWFTGSNDADTVGLQLVSFGDSFAQFGSAVENLSNDRVEAAALSMSAVFKALKDAPNTGGMVSWFTGNNDGDVIGTQLSSFGEAFASFGISVENLKHDKIIEASETMVALFAALKEAPNSGGVVSWFTGNNDGDLVGEQLSKFGEGLASFGKSVTNLNGNAITAATNTIKTLFESLKTMPNMTGLFGYTEITDLSEQLVFLGQGLSEFASLLSGDTLSILSSSENILSSLFTSFANIDLSQNSIAAASALISSLLDALTSPESYSLIQVKMGELSTFIISVVDTHQFAILGETIIGEISSGMSKLNVLDGAIDMISETILKTLNDIFPKQTEDIGEDVVNGLITGMRNRQRALKQMSISVAKVIEDGLRDTLKTHSDSEITTEIGEDVDGGLNTGMKRKKREVLATAADVGTGTAQTLLSSANTYIDANGNEFAATFSAVVDAAKEVTSPIADDAGTEVGNALVNSTGKAIKDNKTAEEIAKEKAEAIVSNFSAGLSKLSDVLNILDLEYQLFEKSYGYVDPDNDAAVYAKDAALNAAQLETASKQLTVQQERAATAQEVYNQTLKEFGQDSEYTRARLQELYQEQIKVADMINQINDLQRGRETLDKDYVEAQKGKKEANLAKQVDYLNKIVEIEENLAKTGMTFSDEDVRKAAAKATGYDPEWQKNADKLVSDAVVHSMETVSSVYSENVDNTLGKLTYNYEKVGISYGEATATGLIYGGRDVVETSKKVAIASVQTFEQYRPLWVEAGAFLGQGLVDGILSKLDEIAAAGTQAGVVALYAVRTALALGSPSKETIEYGRFVDQGLAIGLTRYADVAEIAAEQMGNSTIDRLREVLSEIDTVIDTDMDMTPTITPVIDIDATKRQVAALNAMLNKSAGLSTTVQKATSISADKSGTVAIPSQNGRVAENGRPITFIQNNTSPKALSRIDIYRQTKNQLSAAKGLVNK